MKVLITINTTIALNIGGANYGGIEVYVNSLACALAKRNIEVDIVCSSDSKSFIEGVHTLDAGQVATKTLEAQGKRGIRFNWDKYMEAIKSLDIKEYDLIVCNNHYWPLLKYLNDNCRGNNIILYTQILPIWRDENQKYIEKHLNELTNIHQLAISELICDRWNEKGCNMSYVPYGFEDKFNGNLVNSIYYNNLAMACRIISEKRPLELMELTREFNSRYEYSPRMYCNIIGKGNGTYYDKVNQESVEGLGLNEAYSGDNYKWIYYLSQYCPIVVNISKIEALGITPIEGFMCGLPCYTIQRYNNAVSETLSRRKNILDKEGLGGIETLYSDKDFIVTNLGGVAKNNEAFIKMVHWCFYNKPFDRYNIREYFKVYYSMDTHINNFLKYIEQ